MQRHLNHSFSVFFYFPTTCVRSEIKSEKYDDALRELKISRNSIISLENA